LEGILQLIIVHTLREEQARKTSCAAEPYF